MKLHLLVALLSGLAAMLHGASALAPIPAFPGAEGAGALARGGRGGRVIYVTNLEDAGAGSLRAAVETPEPRTVVFAISGTIELASPLVITEPFLTIAGQTAPGEGICLANFGGAVAARHVILRHLRFRPGDRMKQPVDGLTIEPGAQDVIVDHCSFSWSVDECLSVSGIDASRITAQWCLIAESLNRSVHHKGEHGMGTLIRTTGDVSFHHNIYAHHNSRAPRVGTYMGMGDRGVVFDFRNNVIYGWGSVAGYTSGDKANVNYVGNYVKANASSARPGIAFHVGGEKTRMYLADNVLEGNAEATADNWKMVADAMPATPVTAPFALPAITMEPAAVAYARVLAEAGATLPKRDAADARIVDQIRKGTGRIINSQSEVGGWPKLARGPALRDADQDGMPDAWEIKHKLDPKDPKDGVLDANGDGYTNLEEYLNGRNPRA